MRTRQLVEIVNAAIQPLQNTSVLKRLSSENVDPRAWAAHFNENGLAAYEALLEQIAQESGGNGPFSLGESLTAADIFLVPQLYSARRFHVDVSRFPRALAAEQAALATPHAEGRSRAPAGRGEAGMIAGAPRRAREGGMKKCSFMLR